MATWADLKTFVNADGSSTADDIFIQQCWAEAQALVDGFVGTKVVPVAIKDRAYLSVGAELFHVRQAPNGIAQFQGFDGAPVRIARDPMIAAYSLLGKYMVIGL